MECAPFFSLIIYPPAFPKQAGKRTVRLKVAHPATSEAVTRHVVHAKVAPRRPAGCLIPHRSKCGERGVEQLIFQIVHILFHVGQGLPDALQPRFLYRPAQRLQRIAPDSLGGELLQCFLISLLVFLESRHLLVGQLHLCTQLLRGILCLRPPPAALCRYTRCRAAYSQKQHQQYFLHTCSWFKRLNK